MSEAVSGDNAGKTPERLKVEEAITKRLRSTTRFQRAGSALGILLGVSAGLTYNTPAPDAVPLSLILATLPVIAKKHHEHYRAYVDCDTVVYAYQKAVASPAMVAYDAVKRVDLNDIGGTESLFPPLISATEAYASYVSVAILSAPEAFSNNIEVAAGSLIGTLAIAGVVASEIYPPSKDIALYTRQLDNVDFNTGIAPAAEA